MTAPPLDCVVISRQALDQLLAAAELAARYMDHPAVQSIGFSLPASAVAERLRAAICSAPVANHRALLAVAEAAKEHVRHCMVGRYNQDLLTLMDALEAWAAIAEVRA